MSTDAYVVCDRCRKYVWIGKTGTPTPWLDNKDYRNVAPQFVFNHLFCDSVGEYMEGSSVRLPVSKLRILLGEEVPESYENMDP